MTADRYRQINSLADALLEMSPDKRAAFLTRICESDHELRDQVERLVEAQSSCSDFLEAPVLEMVARSFATGCTSDDLTGRHIRQYRIVSRLGAGGIGEVWLARDTQLTRDVALKVLSPQFARDPQQNRRFRLEARAASLLNHPNIVTIYEILEYEGLEFIAEEFVPGETLRQRLRNGALDPNQAVDIVIQVAAALAAAHHAGIIHRDIKPENIMIRPDGLVKVVDFGLARFLPLDDGGSSADLLSRPGVVLGTVRYMSPEQARGLPVHASADIFSLGAVLYEMLMGTPPFSGPTTADVLAAILSQDPPPMSFPALGPATRELDRIARRCLQKDQSKRYSTMAELRQALITRELTSPSVFTPVFQKLSRAHTARWSMYVLTALVGVAALGITIFFLTRRRQAPVTLNTMTITRLATRGKSTGAAVSPDGRSVAYVLREMSGESLRISQLASGGADVRVAAAEPGEHLGLKYSADGVYLYYRLKTATGGQDLYRVPARGGTPVKVMENVPGSIAFAPDGKHIALVRIDPARTEASLAIANTDGSSLRTIRTRQRPEYYSRNGIAWSPDGSAIACFAGKATEFSPEAFRLLSVQVANGAERSLSSETWAWVDSISWAADDIIAIDASKERQDAGQLWLLKPSTGSLTRITNDLTNYRRVTISGDGRTLVALQTRRDVDLWVAHLGSPERAGRIVSENVYGMSSLAWTPARQIVFSAFAGGWRNLWTVDSDGGNLRQLTSGPSDKGEVAVTPDDRYVLYSSRGTIWRIDRDGGNAKQLTRGFWDVHPAASPDSQSVFYASFRNWSPAIWDKPTIWRVPIGGGSPVQVIDKASSFPEVSPDGSRVLCEYLQGSNPEQAASNAAVFSLQSGRLLKVFGFGSQGGAASWTSDGKALVYGVRTHGVANLWRLYLARGQAAPITNFDSGDVFTYAMSPDSTEAALARGRETNVVVSIMNFR